MSLTAFHGTPGRGDLDQRQAKPNDDPDRFLSRRWSTTFARLIGAFKYMAVSWQMVTKVCGYFTLLRLCHSFHKLVPIHLLYLLDLPIEDHRIDTPLLLHLTLPQQFLQMSR